MAMRVDALLLLLLLLFFFFSLGVKLPSDRSLLQTFVAEVESFARLMPSPPIAPVSRIGRSFTLWIGRAFTLYPPPIPAW